MEEFSPTEKPIRVFYRFVSCDDNGIQLCETVDEKVRVRVRIRFAIRGMHLGRDWFNRGAPREQRCLLSHQTRCISGQGTVLGIGGLYVHPPDGMAIRD